MAEDDIYGSKKRYERWLKNIQKVTETPSITSRTKYWCKNKANVKYFKKLTRSFEIEDVSYINRVRKLDLLRLVTYVCEKDLKDCTRDDVDDIVAYAHKVHKTVASKHNFIKNFKRIWKILFPELDHLGRVDETITPYVVRHIKRKIDVSRHKLRNDKLTWEEFQRIMGYFSGDTQMQAYLMLAVESLGRPQEILYTKIKDYEFHDNFAKVWISEHGKEGTGFLQCIDSYPYVMEWFKQHPYKHDPNCFFFIAQGNKAKHLQLKNAAINRRLHIACKKLEIDKTITCYSLKRNGVTFCRERGDSDMEIQHRARWTSTKQLQNYDLTTQEDALKVALNKRGIGKAKTKVNLKVKDCTFCAYRNGFSAEFCTNCNRPLDREKIKGMAEQYERMANHQMLQRLDKIEQRLQSMIV